MDFLYEPIDDSKAPTGFEPLDWDDEELDEDEDTYVFEDQQYEEEGAYEEQGLAGWDDLKPFGSFDDGTGWDDDGSGGLGAF